MAKEIVMETGTTVDIHKIIDDAMAAKDRTVCIFITGENMSVSVTPLGEDKPRWIKKVGENPNEDEDMYCYKPSIYACSECGYEDKFFTPYCPMCGEKLKLPN